MIEQWNIKPLSLPKANEYLEDLSDLWFADSGILTEVNPFFFINEACQLLANSVKLFELGYFDLSTSTAFWTSSTDKPYTKYGKDDVYRVYVAFRNTYENAVFGRVFLEKNARYIRSLKD